MIDNFLSINLSIFSNKSTKMNIIIKQNIPKSKLTIKCLNMYLSNNFNSNYVLHKNNPGNMNIQRINEIYLI